MTTQGVDRLRSLANQQIAGAEHHGCRLRLFTLHGDKAHGRALGGLADRLGIRHVVLLALDERLYIGRRDQPHLVAELSDGAAPIVRARAGLHGDDAAGLACEEGQHLLAPELLAEQDGAGRARPCAWNTFLARSKPMVLTSSTD